MLLDGCTDCAAVLLTLLILSMNFYKPSIYASYRSGNSVLVVTPRGHLHRLYTPFCVKEITALGTGVTQRRYIVDAVKWTITGRIVYVINGRPHYHHRFAILLQLKIEELLNWHTQRQSQSIDR
jgi:hypothetical protein